MKKEHLTRREFLQTTAAGTAPVMLGSWPCENGESGCYGQTKSTKLLGLIGGLSFASSLDYYREINEEVGKRLGKVHSSQLIMYSLDLEPHAQYAHLSPVWKRSGEKDGVWQTGMEEYTRGTER